MKILSILSKLMKPHPWGGVWGWCSLLSKGGVWGGYLLCCLLLTLFSCSGGDDGGNAPMPDMHTVQLYLSVPAMPADDRTRAGDPGTPTGEGEDWDKMAVIIVYADGTLPSGVNPVVVEFLTKEDFEALPLASDGNPNHRLYTLDVFEGKIYIYGVTYSKEYGGQLEAAINACKTKTDVEQLTISNKYATDGNKLDVAKFLSVATGFYHKEDNKDEPAPFEVKAVTEWTDANRPYVRLLRLAAKIDIQWDAADAYDNSYTDVKLDKFTYYYNGNTTEGEPMGCLFPSRHSVESGGSATFYNTSAVSKRNGRVYHYAFPNGKEPRLHFTVSGIKQGEPERTDISFDYNFVKPLAKATWYKLNVTIKGVSKDVEWSEDFQGPDGYDYTESY